MLKLFRKPALRSAFSPPPLPMDPHEQWAWEELARRRASSIQAHNAPTPASIEDDARVKGISK